MAKPRSSLLDDESDYFDTMLGEAKHRQAKTQAQAEGKDGRGQAGHGGETGRDNRGVSKATYNISLEAQAIVKRIAAQLDAPNNDVVEAAIVLLDSALKRNPKLLDGYLVYARLLNAKWRIELPYEIDFFSER